MVSTSRVAEIGSVLGDPVRVSMMIALLDGRARTARELAELGGVAPQTASSHLSKLARTNMIRVDRQGRHRYHRIASSDVASLLEHMHVTGASLLAGAPQGRVFGPRDRALRELRSCYDHLAGRIAVEIHDRLFMTEGQGKPGVLSSDARSLLQNLGVDLGAAECARRTFCRRCLDWSERRPHIAGALGAAILGRVQELGWVRARTNDRALALSADGERGLKDVFGIAAVRAVA